MQTPPAAGYWTLRRALKLRLRGEQMAWGTQPQLEGSESATA